ncbi:MAG: bifunctional folylpolyglutamate synthase/dihydrofolate synthase [Eubacterium sp.]|nr:bifunctional folylpolyglutamate synthase/dihydrofolate synthase [Eubacterium sp.]
MNYEEAVAYIESVPKFTSKTDLEHTARLLAVLGNPQDRIPHFIHVAGTNGKGSVCSYLNSVLTAAGYRCGLFTSPHLVRINERMQTDGGPVSDEAFLKAFRQVMDAAEVCMQRGDAHPTYFEILFLMAMCLFAECAVHWCILETGMGGRLDQTNVISKPDITVITSVGMDHMQYLGNTLAAIAGEKAGIIKPGIPVIYDADRPEVSEVVCARARETGSPAVPVTSQQCTLQSRDADGIVFQYQRNGAQQAEAYRISSIAEYQMKNAALAAETIEYLRQYSCGGTGQPVLKLTDEQLRKGIRSAVWPCRMERAAAGVYLDGAHNADGIAAFIQTAAGFRKTGEITVLFSAVSDKEYPEMIRQIAEGIRPEHVVVTGVGGGRKVSPEVLAQQFRACGCPDVVTAAGAYEALQAAYQKRGSGTLFCVGSLYLAGELREIINADGSLPPL